LKYTPYILLIILTLFACQRNAEPLAVAEKNLEEARALLASDNYEEAFNLYYRTLDMLEYEAIDGGDAHIALYTDLGSLYKKEGLHKNALEVYHSRYNLVKDKANPDRIALALRDIALTNLHLKRADSCYIYLEQAFEHAATAKDSAAINNMLNNDMSLYFNHQEEYEQSLCHLRMIDNPNEEIFTNKGFVFMKLHDYDSARFNLLQATESDLLYIKSSAYCSLAELEGDAGNYRLAYQYLNAYQQILDSIQQQLHTEEINAMLYQHINEKQTAQVKMKYRWLFMSLVFGFIILVLVLFFLFLLNSRRKKIKQQEQENKLLRQEVEILELNEQHYRNFKEKPIYKQLEELVASKTIFTYKQQDTLKKEVLFYFQSFAKELNTTCPELTEDDILFCCLSKLNLSSAIITLCMGYSRSGTIRQRKYRVKQKMSANDQCQALYNSIFVT